jgi:hypothetical protein
MLVVAPTALELGTAVKMRFASPMTGEMVVVSASVRWTREARGRSAMGLEFESVSPVLRSVVAQYIATTSAASWPAP